MSKSDKEIVVLVSNIGRWRIFADKWMHNGTAI